MKTFTKIWQVVAIVAIIAAGLSACKTTPVELDEEKLAVMENAAWVVKPLVYDPSPFSSDAKFTALKKDEIAYFKSISVTKGLENYKWYALTAPELPGTYYYFQKTTGSMLMGDTFDIWKSTTINEETFNQRNALRSVSWEVKALSGEPSLTGFESLPEHDNESDFMKSVVENAKEPQATYKKWYSVTAPDLPGVTYYYYSTYNRDAAMAVGSLSIYKNEQ